MTVKYPHPALPFREGDDRPPAEMARRLATSENLRVLDRLSLDYANP